MEYSNRTYPEIGSHFWWDEGDRQNDSLKQYVPFHGASDHAFTFSGRTAISLALRDILSVREIPRTAYVPSYCCMSMLQPFLDLGFRLEYYDVVFRDGHFVSLADEKHECGVFLIMRYFGLSDPEWNKTVERMRSKNAVIIEDATHSLLCSEPVSSMSDYFVASLRKWFAIPTGGLYGRVNGSLKVKPDINSAGAVAGKIQAMKEKCAFISGEPADKDSILERFGEFEKDLLSVDPMMQIDPVSGCLLDQLDIPKIVDARRRNADVLMRRLKKYDGKLMQLPDFQEADSTPLFLPVIMRNSERDSLRKFLIERMIYCPVHWPKIADVSEGIEQQELSLICDQRYSENDMTVIADAVDEWYQSSCDRE